MAWTTIKNIFAAPEPLLKQTLEVRGWIRTQRESKNFAFIELNDGSCFKNLQVVYGDELGNFNAVAKFPLGSSLKITGQLVPSPAAGQPFELKAETIEAIGLSALDYPLQKKRHGFEFLRTIPHLRPRTNTFMAVFRVRSLVAYAMHKFFHERGFVYVHTPIITASDAEGAGRDVPRHHPGPQEPAAGRTERDRLQPGFLRPRDQPDRLAASSTSRASAWPSAASTPSAPPSAPKIPTPSATPPSSG